MLLWVQFLQRPIYPGWQPLWKIAISLLIRRPNSLPSNCRHSLPNWAFQCLHHLYFTSSIHLFTPGIFVLALFDFLVFHVPANFNINFPHRGHYRRREAHSRYLNTRIYCACLFSGIFASSYPFSFACLELLLRCPESASLSFAFI